MAATQANTAQAVQIRIVMSEEIEKLKQIKENADKGAERFAKRFDDEVRDIAIMCYREGYVDASFKEVE